MPLGVHLPGCPCNRCQACTPIVEKMSRGHLLPPAQGAPDNAMSAPTRIIRNPWASSADDDE